MSKEVHQQLTEHRCTKRLDEEQEIQAVLNYINVKATELVLKFKQPCRWYLEHFSLGSTIHQHKHHKMSAWHAFMHFKGLKSNEALTRHRAGKDFNEKSNVADLVQHTAEYCDLTDAEKAKLVAEFDAIKKGAGNCPPNITARMCAAECGRSFQYVKEELKALKLRVGTEVMVFMDVAQLATDFESTILASGLLLNTSTNQHDCEVTNNLSATMEFTQYHNLVHRHQVKLVGWTHLQWANPSDLKGGIEGLESLVDAIGSDMCCFVPISSEELEDHLRHVKNGEKLTPKVEPPMPNEPTCNLSPDIVQLSADTDSTPSSPSTAQSTSIDLLLIHSLDLDSTPTTSLPPASDSENESSTVTVLCNVDMNDFSRDDSFTGDSDHEPDVDTSPSTMTTGSTFNESTHVSTFTDNMLDPALRTLTSSTTDTVQCLISPAPSDLPVNNADCTLPHLKLHAPGPQSQPSVSSGAPNRDALVCMMNCKPKHTLTNAVLSHEQCPKRAHKLTEKAQQLQPGSSEKHGQRTGKGLQKGKKSKAVVELDQENV
ncbi:hypothetical protein BDR05DRAFT_952910 [Suillus weaverae]|nr:hypothetical protein BDR05DRAFT_952910 [Suillus weaverae]